MDHDRSINNTKKNACWIEQPSHAIIQIRHRYRPSKSFLFLIQLGKHFSTKCNFLFKKTFSISSLFWFFLIWEIYKLEWIFRIDVCYRMMLSINHLIEFQRVFCECFWIYMQVVRLSSLQLKLIHKYKIWRNRQKR